MVVEEAKEKIKVIDSLKSFYDKHCKKLMIFTLLLLVLAIVQIGVQYATTGDFMNKGVSLKGGLTITIEKSANTDELQRMLDDKFPSADISVRAISSAGRQTGTIVEASDVDADEITKTIADALR